MSNQHNQLLRVILGIFFLAAFTYAHAQEKKATPQDKLEANLLRVTTLSSKVYVGQVIENGKSTVRFLDLVSNEPVEIEKSDVKEVLNPLPFDDAVKSIGLPRLLSWKIGLLAKKMNNTGKVARVTAQVVYVTLGNSSGVRVGTVFSVFRNEGEIKDPVTGAVLGIERPMISTLEVTEVEENLSKAKIVSNLEIPIQVGDEVKTKLGLVIAVCPLCNEDGELTSVGSTMSEQITNSLVQANIKVVERSVLDTVLSELMVQNTILFDPKSAQKLGELTGANYVVTGKIVPSRNTGIAFVRLVDVKSGEIALAASTDVKLTSASNVPSNQNTARNKNAVNVTGNRSGSFKDGRLPSFLTTTTRVSKSPKGIVIAEGGVIRTSAVNFLDRDFTFEVLMDNSRGGAHVGMGITNSVQLQMHTTAIGDNRGEVKLNESIIGYISDSGAHLVRIQKERDTVIFHIDVGNDGPTDDDIETIISNIREHVPSFHSKNVPLFMSGSAEFISARVK